MPIPPFGAPPAKVKSLVAGSNISLSPTSGTGNVTISASVSGGSSPLTTTGDLYGYTTTNARLPVGADGVPLQAASTQSIGLGYGVETYNFAAQSMVNANQLLIGEVTTPALPLIELIDANTRVTTSNYYGLNIHLSPTFATSNVGSGSAWLNVDGTWTINSISGKANIAAMNFAPTLAGSVAPGLFYGIQAKPSYGNSGTLATYVGMFIQPIITSSTTATSAGGIFIGAQQSGGTFTTFTGLDVGNQNPLAGSTIWALRIGNYNSFFAGNTTFGGTGTPTYAVHVRGGSASVNAIGMDVSTVPPVEPGSSGAMAMQCYEGSGGTNRYFLISYNDGGTQRYKYVILNGTGVTWTESTTLPT